MSNCPWVHGKSNKPPPEVCVGAKYLFRDLTYIFSFINIHEYANEIILYITIVCKDLSNYTTDDIITCNKDSLGAEFSLYLLFLYIIFPYFLKFSSVLMNMQIR